MKKTVKIYWDKLSLKSMERDIPVHGLEEAICKDVTISKIELNFTTVLTVFLLFAFFFFLKKLTALVIIYMDMQRAESS